ncbi:MAG: ABC transporter permease [Granulosicoccus sp.]
MLRLFMKESRQLFPIGCLWIAVLVLNYVIQFATERFDEQTFTSWCDGYCDYNSSATIVIFSALIALVTAYSLFPREHDDATIDFLRALPVSRSSVFIAKVLAAWVLLCAITLLAYAIDAAMLATNPESIGGRFYPQVWTTLLWRDCVVAFIILSHGVFLSWFRTIGLVIYAVYLVLLMWAESALGTTGVWSIFTLLANEYDGSNLIVNSQALTIHAGIAVVMLVVAYLLWSRTESSISGSKPRTRGLKFFRGLLSVTGFLILAIVLVYRVGVETGSAGSADLKVATTEYYRFVYPASREDTVQYMLEHADADYVMLGNLLGVEQLPRIRVDLSAQSEHAAGLATWKKIKMDLNAFEADVSQRRVLSHETTHVLQAVESDRALTRNYAAVKFFIEGMAQYTSFEVVPEEARRDSNWQLAAISWQRQKIEFDDLIDEAGFSEQFDPELHYSLGDLWTRAFVSVCGEEALGGFLRAAGRPDAVKGLPAAIFWRDTAGQIGCDLDTVNEQWRQQMQELHASIDQSHFPAYTDVVVTRDEQTSQIVITASLSAYVPNDSARGNQPENESIAGMVLPERFIVRVGATSGRLAASVDPVYRGQLVEEQGATKVRFVIPASVVSGSRFRYQPGFSPFEGSRYYYESWKRGSV